MSDRIELSKSRAKKLIKCWEGHIKDNVVDGCGIESVSCPIHKYFMELKKKTKNYRVVSSK